MSNVNIAGEAFCVMDVNFTAGIETGGSFLASGHQKPTEGMRAELVGSTGVGSPVRASTDSVVGTTVVPTVCHS